MLDALKEKYKNAFQIKRLSNKLKVTFINTKDFSNFKAICQKENIEYHTYMISIEKTTTVALKDLIKLPESRICSSIKNQGLNPVSCTEISTHAKYSIYRVTFALGTQINHVRYIENIKIYWNTNQTNQLSSVIDAKHTDTSLSTATRKQFALNALDHTTQGQPARKPWKYHPLVETAREITLRISQNARHFFRFYIKFYFN